MGGARGSRGFRLQFSSRLAAPAAKVWAEVSTMEGVNRELGPFVRMSVPREARGLALADAPIGETAFHSWLLAGGLVPFDRHALRLVEVLEDGFVEDSTSWLQARWRHERHVVPIDDRSCEVTDQLDVEPRVGASTPLARFIVKRLFTHRHRVLRARFGAA